MGELPFTYHASRILTTARKLSLEFVFRFTTS